VTSFKDALSFDRAAKKTAARVGWVDCVKGLTIIMVVAHHAVLGLAAKGLAHSDVLRWDESLAAVRMPLFFLVAGLFAKRAIDGPLQKFLDGKVVHFAYFYFLWSLILFFARFGSNDVAEKKTRATEILAILWDPISTIWFMYGLMLAFLFVRLLRSLPPLAIVATALAIQTLALASPPVPGAMIINKFDHLLFYFVLGVYGSAWIRNQANSIKPATAAGLILSFIVVAVPATMTDTLRLPIVYTVISLLGVSAVIAVAAAGQDALIARGLSYVGKYSLPIYLSHFLPVAAIRIVLMHVGVHQAVILCAACVFGSVVLGIAADVITRRTPLSFLFQRPRWARLSAYQGSAAAKTGFA